MKAEDIRALAEGERNQRLTELKQALFNLRFQQGIGQLENPCKIKETQKDIARIYTIIGETARKSEETDN